MAIGHRSAATITTSPCPSEVEHLLLIFVVPLYVVSLPLLVLALFFCCQMEPRLRNVLGQVSFSLLKLPLLW